MADETDRLQNDAISQNVVEETKHFAQQIG